MATSKLEQVELSRIRPGFNARPAERMTPTKLKSLGESLERDGQLRSIGLRVVDGGFSILYGHRTYSAAKLNGTKSLDAKVYYDLSDEDAVRLSYIENAQREDLDPIAEARYFWQLLGLQEPQLWQESPTGPVRNGVPNSGLPSHLSPDVERVAKTVGENDEGGKKVIANRLTLLALPEDLQKILTSVSFDDSDEPMSIRKAEILARLRLLGDKAVAHNNMLALWKQVKESRVPVTDDILASWVDTTVKAFKQEAAELQRKLAATKEKITASQTGLQEAMADILMGLPDDFELPEDVLSLFDAETEQEFFGAVQGIIETLTRDTTWELAASFVEARKTTIESALEGLGGEEPDDRIEDLVDLVVLDNDQCPSCESKVAAAVLKRRASELAVIHDGFAGKMETQLAIRNNLETARQKLGQSMRDFDAALRGLEATLDRLVQLERLSKTQAETIKRDALGISEGGQ